MIFIAIWWSAMAAAALLIAREMWCKTSFVFIAIAVFCIIVANFCFQGVK